MRGDYGTRMKKYNKYMKLFQTMVVTGLAYMLNYGINLVLVPYITDNVGTEAYGYVSLAKQFAEYAAIVVGSARRSATFRIFPPARWRRWKPWTSSRRRTRASP